jgi:cysteine desulfurase
MIYLDNASTTKIAHCVFETMIPYLTNEYGNPSSTYSLGLNAKQAIQTAKKRIAKSINAKPNEIFFTSGATESNNIVGKSYSYIFGNRYEHHSISKQPNFIDINMKIDEVPFIETCSSYSKPIIASMLVNNETGDIFDVSKYKEKADIIGCKLLVDGTQAFGHIPINVKELNCDYLSLSAHKCYAPKGIGILYIKDGDISDLNKGIVYGGNQNPIKSGTENVASIVGFGEAVILFNYNIETDNRIFYYENKIKMLLDYINIMYGEEIVRINSFRNNFDNNSSYYSLGTIHNIINMSFKYINGSDIMEMLAKDDIYVSTGSACNSNDLEPSDVLKMLNVPKEYINGTIRVSIGNFNNLNEIENFCSRLSIIVRKLLAYKGINRKDIK